MTELKTGKFAILVDQVRENSLFGVAYGRDGAPLMAPGAVCVARVRIYREALDERYSDFRFPKEGMRLAAYLSLGPKGASFDYIGRGVELI